MLPGLSQAHRAASNGASADAADSDGLALGPAALCLLGALATTIVDHIQRKPHAVVNKPAVNQWLTKLGITSAGNTHAKFGQ